MFRVARDFMSYLRALYSSRLPELRPVRNSLQIGDATSEAGFDDFDLLLRYGGF
jgi:hypothetical protein